MPLDTVPPPIKQRITDQTGMCDRTWAVWFRGLYQEQRDTGRTFLRLSDTPSSYSAQGLELLRVNTSESAVEFTTIGSIVSGTPNEIEVSGTTTLTIGLPDDVTIINDLTVGNDINITGNIDFGLTPGSVAFQGTNGITEDNVNFFWDDTNDRLGIGTNSPSQDLTVAGNQLITSDNKLYFRNTNVFIHSNDSNDLYLSTYDGDGDIFLYSGVRILLSAGETDIINITSAGAQVYNNRKLYFNDTDIYINSSVDGQLDIVADTEIQIATPTIDINGDVDISDTLTVNGSGPHKINSLLGVGGDHTDGILHVIEGSAGSVSASSEADVAVFEMNGSDGISILAPDNAYSRMYFGSPSNNAAAKLYWRYTDLEFFIGTNEANAKTILMSGASTVAITLDPTDGILCKNNVIADDPNVYAIGAVGSEFSDIYLGQGAIIYGQDDQSNTITSSATGWTFNLKTTAPRYDINDANTYITEDGSSNMTFTDAVTGTKTLAELAEKVTINNDADNRLVTALGTGDLNAEANLTFDGSTATIIGNVVIGPANSDTNQTLNVVGTTGNEQIQAVVYSTNSNLNAAFEGIKSHSDTIGTDATTLDGEKLFSFSAKGVDSGGNKDLGAKILFQQNGAADVRVPTDIIFQTATSTATVADAFVICSDKTCSVRNDDAYLTVGEANDFGFKYDGTNTIFEHLVGSGYSRFNDTVVIGPENSPSDQRLNVVGTTGNEQIRGVVYNTNVNVNAAFEGAKSHSNVIGTNTTTIDGEKLFSFSAKGVDSGGNIDLGAKILFQQDGNSGVRVPTRIVFQTATSTATVADGFAINSDKSCEMPNDDVYLKQGDALDVGMKFLTDWIFDYDLLNSGTTDFRIQEHGTDRFVILTGGNATFSNNLTVSGTLGLASGTTINEFSTDGTLAGDSDDAVPTEQAVKTYVDTQITAQDLDFAGDAGTGAVDLDSQTFTIAGTASEIETSASGQTLTVGLPDDVTIAGNLTVSGEGPHSIGHVASGKYRMQFGSDFTTDGSNPYCSMLFNSGTLTGVPGTTSVLSGVWSTASITTQTAEDTIADITQLRLDEPKITNNLTGGGVIINASTLLIRNAPTEGQNNYAILVDSGAVKFGGTTESTGLITATAGISTGGDIYPTSAGGANVGSTTNEFLNVHLADGAVIYGGNDQDQTITHIHNIGWQVSGELYINGEEAVIKSETTGELDLSADDRINSNSEHKFLGNIVLGSDGRTDLGTGASSLANARSSQDSVEGYTRVIVDPSGAGTDDYYSFSDLVDGQVLFVINEENDGGVAAKIDTDPVDQSDASVWSIPAGRSAYFCYDSTNGRLEAVATPTLTT